MRMLWGLEGGAGAAFGGAGFGGGGGGGLLGLGGGGFEAELAADLGEAGLGLGVHRRLLDLEHPRHDRLGLQLDRPDRLGESGLDLDPDLLERVDSLYN